MQTNQLKRDHKNKKRMTVGRGGRRGKTSGRGGKGQTARAGNKRRPEWRDIIKKIPKLRGRGVNQNKPISDKPAIVNLNVLEEVFSSGDSITPTILAEKGLINLRSGKVPIVKILGAGEITKILKISGCEVSKSAKIKIEKVKGEIVLKTNNKSSVATVETATSVDSTKQTKTPRPTKKKAV
jgi:large subunit ribosomal protein L15